MLDLINIELRYTDPQIYIKKKISGCIRSRPAVLPNNSAVILTKGKGDPASSRNISWWLVDWSDVAVTTASSTWCANVTWRESVSLSLTYRLNLTDPQVSLQPLKLACHDDSGSCVDVSNIQEWRQDDVCFARKLASCGWLARGRDI